MPERNSIFLYFIVGFLLLLTPLVLIIFWNQIGCVESTAHNAYCPTKSLLDDMYSFLPFLMVIGGVLIGYNFKRISDSFLPPKEEPSSNGEGKKHQQSENEEPTD